MPYQRLIPGELTNHIKRVEALVHRNLQRQATYMLHNIMLTRSATQSNYAAWYTCLHLLHGGHSGHCVKVQMPS